MNREGNIVLLSNDGIHTLIDIVIVKPIQTNLVVAVCLPELWSWPLVSSSLSFLGAFFL
jgi:hypothetical protein